MRFKVKKFYQSRKNFQHFYYQLKQIPCPHCQFIGGLILHGHLYGYDEKNSHKKIVRGHRIFCSNRYRRKGCGKTFSVLAAHILKGFIINAHSLWKFLKNIARGMTKFQAFRSLDLSFSNTTIYRLWNAFSCAQSRLRTLLISRCPCPAISHHCDPVIETILHLKSAFKNNNYVLPSFQHHFQTSVL